MRPCCRASCRPFVAPPFLVCHLLDPAGNPWSDSIACRRADAYRNFRYRVLSEVVCGSAPSGWVRCSSPRSLSDPPTRGPVRRRAGCRRKTSQAIVRRQLPRVRACYRSGTSNDRDLRGRVTVKFVIGGDGHVISTSDGGSDPDPGRGSLRGGASFARSCFRRPNKGSSWSNTPSCSRLAAATSRFWKWRALSPKPKTRFQLCYEEALREDPSLEGHVRVRVVIDPRARCATPSAKDRRSLPVPFLVWFRCFAACASPYPTAATSRSSRP